MKFVINIALIALVMASMACTNRTNPTKRVSYMQIYDSSSSPIAHTLRSDTFRVIFEYKDCAEISIFGGDSVDAPHTFYLYVESQFPRDFTQQKHKNGFKRAFGGHHKKTLLMYNDRSYAGVFFYKEAPNSEYTLVLNRYNRRKNTVSGYLETEISEGYSDAPKKKIIPTHSKNPCDTRYTHLLVGEPKNVRYIRVTFHNLYLSITERKY